MLPKFFLTTTLLTGVLLASCQGDRLSQVAAVEDESADQAGATAEAEVTATLSKTYLFEIKSTASHILKSIDSIKGPKAKAAEAQKDLDSTFSIEKPSELLFKINLEKESSKISGSVTLNPDEKSVGVALTQ